MARQSVGGAKTLTDFARSKVFGGLDLYGAQLAAAWTPQAVDAQGAPDLVVDFKGAGTKRPRFATLQAAIDHATQACADEPVKQRRVIAVGPGFFDGPVVIPPQAPPITLQGAGQGQTILAAGIDAQMPGLEYRARFGPAIAAAGASAQAQFASVVARQTIGTHNTAVLKIARDDVVITGMTICNTYQCDRGAAAPAGAEPDAQGRFATGQHQAVAVLVDGADRVRITACSMSSFQDTLYLRAHPHKLSRVALDHCDIEGDVDFIFGGATAHFHRCDIRSRGARGARSWATAPSTWLHHPYGFVFDGCAFTHDGAEAGQGGQSYLGRQWFEGVRATPYGSSHPAGYECWFSDVNRYEPTKGTINRATLEAVGKCAVVNTTLGPHLAADHLWDAWGGPDWSPRYRPVQTGPADFVSLLGGWLARNGLDYPRLEGSPEWLVTRNLQITV